MSIQVALLKMDEDERLIDVLEIESSKDYQNVKNNLYCAFGGCGCKLQYVPRGKYKAYLKTWPNDDHIEDCEDHFKREEIKTSNKNSATVDVTLTTAHIKRVLKELYKEANESPQEKQKRLEKRNEQKKKNSVTDRNQVSETSVINIRPSTDKSTSTQNDTLRKPNIRKRHNIALLSESDIGYARAIYGEIIRVEINEEKDITVRLRHDDKLCDVNLGEAFFSDAPVNTVRNLTHLKSIVEKIGEKVFLSCVGHVSRKDEDIYIVIHDTNNLTLNDKALASFIFHYNNR